MENLITTRRTTFVALEDPFPGPKQHCCVRVPPAPVFSARGFLFRQTKRVGANTQLPVQMPVVAETETRPAGHGGVLPAWSRLTLVTKKLELRHPLYFTYFSAA